MAIWWASGRVVGGGGGGEGGVPNAPLSDCDAERGRTRDPDPDAEVDGPPREGYGVRAVGVVDGRDATVEPTIELLPLPPLLPLLPLSSLLLILLGLTTERFSRMVGGGVVSTERKGDLLICTRGDLLVDLGSDETLDPCLNPACVHRIPFGTPSARSFTILRK